MNLSMIRGDTLAFGFVVEGIDQIDEAYFTIKKTKDATKYVCQKTLGHGIQKDDETGIYTVRVAPEDTYNVEPNLYYYDLQLNAIDDVFTVLNGALKIDYDITREV